MSEQPERLPVPPDRMRFSAYYENGAMTSLDVAINCTEFSTADLDALVKSLIEIAGGARPAAVPHTYWHGGSTITSTS